MTDILQLSLSYIIKVPVTQNLLLKEGEGQKKKTKMWVGAFTKF